MTVTTFSLLQENECFQEELRKAQRALLRVRRDKSFLLDRLLQYQRGPDSSTDSEQTEESDTEVDAKGDHKRCVDDWWKADESGSKREMSLRWMSQPRGGQRGKMSEGRGE